MGTDYHRGPTQSIPIGDQLPPETQGWPRHNPGAQLPHADLVHQERQLNPETRPYPGVLDRDQWATEKIILHKFNLAEGAVLRRICHYAGTPQGCWAGIDRIALEISAHEKTVRRAINTLREANVVLQGPWRDRVRTLLLNFDDTSPAENQANDSGHSARSQLTDTGLSARSQLGDIGLSARSGESDEYPDSGHSARSEPQHIGLSARSGAGDSGHSVPDSGHCARLTGKNKKEEREDIDNLSLFSGFPSGSPGRKSGVALQTQGTPVRETGVAGGDGPTPPEQRSESPPTSDRKSEVAQQRNAPEDERIRALVVENWTLIEKGGWNFLEPAIKHYQTHGMTYLQRDLRIKRENLAKEELATRTCAHCKTVHDNTDQLRPCAMCNELKCVSELSICHRTGCQGKTKSRGQPGPSSRQRR